MTTIVLADDHHIIRQALQALLESQADFSVIGEASDGLQALEVTTRLCPDVLVVDVIMPGLNGLDVTREVVSRCRTTRVLVLSAYDNETYVLDALRYGATGYVLKDSTTDDLLQAVRDVAAGRYHLSGPLQERTIMAYVERARTTPAGPYETLSSRERVVLHLTAEGYNTSEIANRLSINLRTVENHRANLMRKLGLRSQADLRRFALERGILREQ